MKRILIILFFLPICVSAQRYKEQLNFNSTGDQEMALGRYRIGTIVRIECQIGGGWAEDGGIYHIAADWGHQPKVIYRGESSISTRLKFYGYVDPSTNSYAFLYATWDNVSPSENYGNDVKFTIYSEGNFDVNNKGSFANSTELENVLVVQSNTGRVGIGTNSPISLVDISSGTSGDAVLRIESDTDNAGSEADNSRIEMYQDARLIGVKLGFNEDIATPANHFQIDMVYPGGISKNALTIHPYSGKIGLGILATSEDARLIVDGKILAEEIKVQNVPASDYVFEPDYALRPIQEVETFVKENKHLPDIPSAEEFKQNGVGLGEMDDMLLRKVEELTLYVIEQAKQLKAQSEKLNAKDEEMEDLKVMIKALMQKE